MSNRYAIIVGRGYRVLYTGNSVTAVVSWAVANLPNGGEPWGVFDTATNMWIPTDIVQSN